MIYHSVNREPEVYTREDKSNTKKLCNKSYLADYCNINNDSNLDNNEILVITTALKSRWNFLLVTSY